MPPPGTLFRNGCVVDGILNCTAACLDVNQIFADPHTFQNCMVVASLTVLGPTVTLDANSTDLVEEFSIHIDEPDFQSLASGVNQTIQDCLQQYLGNSSGYFPQVLPWYEVANGSESVNIPTFPGFCANLKVPLNADIGGIGVKKPLSSTRTNLLMPGLHLLLASRRHLALSLSSAETLR